MCLFDSKTLAQLRKAASAASLAACFSALTLTAFAADPAKEVGKLVVLGDSLSAGFQNFSLFTSNTGGQTKGFAALIANQAGVPLVQPNISYPGLPPALTLSAGGIVREAGIGSRINPAQATNLSVPGFTVADAIVHAFPGSPSATNTIDVLSDTILGTPAGQKLGCGPVPTILLRILPLPPAASSLIPRGSPLFVSEVTCALALNPDTLVVSIGANDVLQSLTLGLAPTDPAVFQANYRILVRSLALTNPKMVVSNIPDVTTLPFLINSAAFQAQCGVPLPAGVDYVVPDVASATFNVCIDSFPVNQATVDFLQARVVQYNSIIKSEIASLHALGLKVAVADVNAALHTIAITGYDVAGKHLTTQFLGGIFSLDGVHPTNTGYAILANTYIGAMNQSLGMHIPLVNVAAVAVVDPLVH